MKSTMIEFYKLQRAVSSFIETPNIKVSFKYKNYKNKKTKTRFYI